MFSKNKSLLTVCFYSTISFWNLNLKKSGKRSFKLQDNFQKFYSCIQSRRCSNPLRFLHWQTLWLPMERSLLSPNDFRSWKTKCWYRYNLTFCVKKSKKLKKNSKNNSRNKWTFFFKVGGSWKNETGHWHQSCFQIELKSYQLNLKSGYFKSVHDLMYCDAIFGPFIARKEAVKYGKLIFNRPSLLLEFVIAENLRVTHCPDCMFYSNVKNLRYEARLNIKLLAQQQDCKQIFNFNGKAFIM